MLQAAIETVNISLFKYNFIFNKHYWLFFLSVFFGFNIDFAIAQKNIANITIDRNKIEHSQAIQGISGGAIAAVDITQTTNTSTGYCDGFVRQQPNHILKLNAFFDYLRLEVESSADTTVLVKGAGGIWCNDDAGSANPMIEGQWQPGIYQIWVGSYQPDSSDSYQIKITGK